MPLPEPFASHPSLSTIALPNSGRGVPGVQLAREARHAGHHASLRANLGPVAQRTAPPFPGPARAPGSDTSLFIHPGTPTHTLVTAYWAFGWEEGYCEAMSIHGAGHPSRTAFLAERFPNQNAYSNSPYDATAVISATAQGTAFAPPRWAEWFQTYAARTFKASTPAT